MAAVLLTGTARPWQRPLAEQLRERGHVVTLDADARYDLAVVDALDDRQLQVLTRLRPHAPCAILAVTIAADAAEVLERYALGADDCVNAIVPVAPLAAAAHWLATHPTPTGPDRLLPVERRLLAALSEADGHGLSAAELTGRVWGPLRPDTAAPLRVHLAHLRRRFPDDIRVIRDGNGWRACAGTGAATASRHRTDRRAA